MSQEQRTNSHVDPQSTSIPDELIDGPDAGTGEVAVMLTVHDVARMLRCSDRTVYRLTDSGRMPRPVRLGALIRWPKVILERWRPLVR